MLDWIVEAGVSLQLAVGLPGLFVLFVLKGAIVGKVLPTSVLLPGYVIAVSASRRTIAASVLVASLGYVSGQLLIYAIASRYEPATIRSIPGVRVSDAQLRSADRLFGRYSGAGIFVTNLVPYLGSFVMIPAGAASYPFDRAAVYATVSTVLNYVLIVSVATTAVRFTAIV